MHRCGLALIGFALLALATLLAMLLGDAFAPARLPPLLAFWLASGAGLALFLGLALLEERGYGPSSRAS